MTNPPNNLTAKFQALSSDVNTYIQTCNAKLETINTAIGAGNDILSDILAKLAALQLEMKRAADCACEAASTLEEISDQIEDQEEPPPAAGDCSSAASDPDELNYASGAITDVWARKSQTSEWTVVFDAVYQDIPGATLNNGGATPGIVLPGPRWYSVTFDYDPEQIDGTPQYRVNGNTTQAPFSPKRFFVANSAVFSAQFIYSTNPSVAPDITFNLDYCQEAE